MSTFDTAAIAAAFQAVNTKAQAANQAEVVAATSRTATTSAIDKYNRELADFGRKLEETLDEIEHAIEVLENMKVAVEATPVPAPIVNPDAASGPEAPPEVPTVEAEPVTRRRRRR